MRLAKSASFTRWDARPLSAEQLGYAREDVVHLLELAGELERRLRSSGAWSGRARSASRSSAVKRRARPRDDLRAPAAGSRTERLGADDRARAGAWREQTAAAAQDRPVQSVLGDAALVEIAKRKPSSRKQLEQIRGVGAAQPAPSRPRSCWRPCARRANSPPDRAPQDAAPARDRAGGRAAGRAGGGAGARARPRGRARLRAARRARRPAGDRRRRARSGEPRPTCARCAAGGASWSERSCWSCSTAACRCRCTQRKHQQVQIT